MIINKRIKELKEENYHTPPVNIRPFKNPFLLLSDVKALNVIASENKNDNSNSNTNTNINNNDDSENIRYNNSNQYMKKSTNWQGIIVAIIFAIFVLAFILVLINFKDLKTEVVLRAEAEEHLRNNQQHLEQIVGQRTSELAESNQQLELENREKEKRELILNELLETKNRFFSIIAHDLRGPLSSTASLTEVLAESPDEFSQSEIQEILVNVHKSNKRIYGLLENLLDWAKLQLGTMQFELETLAIDKVISDTFEYLRSQANQKQISVKLELDSKTQVYADKNMLSAAIRNLISNAIKFSHSGGEILVKTELKSPDNKIVHVTITDHGIGIPEDVVDTIFNLDRKYHSEGTAGEPSTGLGLLLVKELVEKNNGQVAVVSSLDEGSTFTITLPV